MATTIEKVQEALPIAWEEYKREHPRFAAELEDQFVGDFLPALLEAVEEGQMYKELVAQTNEECSIAGLVKEIVPLIIDVVTKGALL